MSDRDVPAGKPGGPDNVSTTPELADRLRVHALAKLISTTSRQVLDALTRMGAPAKGAQSSIDRETALRVIETLGSEAAEVEKAEKAEKADSERAGATRGKPSARPAEKSARTTEPAAEAPREAPQQGGKPEPKDEPRGGVAPMFAAPSPMFLPPEPPPAAPAGEKSDEPAVSSGGTAEETAEGVVETKRRRRRGRRGRGRGRGSEDESSESGESSAEQQTGGAVEQSDEPKPEETEAAAGSVSADAATETEATEGTSTGSRRRRRRRRRRGSSVETDTLTDDPPNTITKIRDSRAKTENGEDGIQGVRGSTRLEAKRQRRRDGRDAGRRRAPVLTEAEFLARRESVERTMVVRQRGERSEIAVLEDGVLVEHFVTSSGGSSLVGNVYLGRVQNVLPSMEAAFVDIGRGRNAVLYAGEVDWDAAGLAGKARRIEQALSSGDNILVQVTKDPVGHKGARLTTQISLPGRFLVYVPSGGTHGISRKLPDTERRRLKELLREIVPEDAGVIIRTASEGVSQEALERDVRRLQAQWEVVRAKAEAAGVGSKGNGKSKAPELLYEEPDLMIKVVRDLFNEDFSKLVVEGDDAWDTLHAYISHVAPELLDRLHRHVGTKDVFSEYRIDEQLTKAMDRKVWLPSGGTLVIDRTEAMTVIDVNTGKFTGSGGNLEETVTRNNLEAAEEIVRQLRLRDIGGIIVIDFIDMVLESNRDLVLRRLTECLGRDRTRHQVAEVTSLGLVQMTRKRVGTGLLEAFSTPCEHCRGRGVVLSNDPIDRRSEQNQHAHHGGSRRRSRGAGDQDNGHNGRRRGGSAAPEPAKGSVATEEASESAAERSYANGRPPAVSPKPTPGPTEQPAPSPAPLAAAPEPAGSSASGGAVSARPSVAPPQARQPVETQSAPAPRTEQSQQQVGAGAAPVSVGESRTVSSRPRRRRRVASRPAGPPSEGGVSGSSDPV